MRRRLFSLCLLGASVAARAADPASPDPGAKPSAAAAPGVEAPGAPAEDPPLLPAHLPGYDLRVLDVRKPLLFHIEGAWVEVSVPIFFYLATPAHDEGLKVLRQVAEDLRQLLRKPAWTSAELARVQGELDAGAALLAQP